MTTHIRSDARRGLLQQRGSQKVRRACRAVLLLGPLLGAQLLGTSGCKDQKKCDDAAVTARKAIELKDFSSARQWREYTWKMCRDRSLLDTVDKEILAAEDALAKELETAEKKATELAKQQVNAAQALWLKYDAADVKDQTQDSLEKTSRETKALGMTLRPELKAQFDAYNQQQLARRSSDLTKK